MEVLKMKNPVTQMKNFLDGLIGKHNLGNTQ